MKLHPLSKTVLALAVVKGIFVLSIALSLVLWNIPILSSNSKIWLLFQERSGVALQIDNVEMYNDKVIDFFRHGLNLDFLNEKEASHMKDVKNLTNVLNIMLAFSFVYLLVGFSYLSKMQKKFMISAVRKTSLTVFVATLVLSVMILSNFRVSFLSFHKLVFVRNYIFPSDSLLTALYPDGFFFGLSALYLVSILIVSLMVAIVSHRLKLK